jgi:ATP diphosphatase
MSDLPIESRSDSRDIASRSGSHDAAARFQQLVEIMRTLRSEHGCAWDRQQTVKTLRPFVLQETYELLDALDRGDHDAVRQELGDFLFEAVFLAQICEEEGRFSIADSIASICEKLVRRHPHIFDPDGSLTVASAKMGKASLTPRQVKEQWEEIKAQERKDAGAQDQTVLGGVPRSMPSLLRAYELSSRAAMVGFDWVTTDDVIDKVEEEIGELREAVAAGGGKSPEAEEEFGDLLFALVNVSRKLGIEPEAALRVANDKFQRRFDDVERQVTGNGKKLRDQTLEQLEEHWQRAKATTKRTKG